MLVNYNKANTLQLYYKEEINGSDGKTLVNKFYNFVPGRNEINSDVWKKIVKENKERFENYLDTVFNVVGGKEDKKTGIMVGPEVIKLADLKLKDAKDLVENTFETENLRKLYQEEQLGKNRPQVLKAITTTLKEIEELDKKASEV